MVASCLASTAHIVVRVTFYIYSFKHKQKTFVISTNVHEGLLVIGYILLVIHLELHFERSKWNILVLQFLMFGRV